jgi:hypothetical protein
MEHDRRTIQVIKSSKPLRDVKDLYGGGQFHYDKDVFLNTRDIHGNIATDAGGNIKRDPAPYRRVVGYGFRGESRGSDAIH